MRRWLLVIPLVVLVAAPPAIAQRRGSAPILHESIPPDPKEDIALAVSLDGDIPAAINTPRGPISAPDPAKPVGTGDAPYRNDPAKAQGEDTFNPDRDTRRPDVLPYDDPFSPSTAPFKRLSAFDMVDASYALAVRDPHLTMIPIAPLPQPDATEEHFYADMIVDLSIGQRVRIPSVGPHARVLRARAGIGSQDVKFLLYKDGAENWFIEGEQSTRARLVMDIAVPRVVFGGDFGSPSWAELGSIPALPPNVQRSANEVTAKIGVSRRMSPRENVTKLVSYFRSFAESEDPPVSTRDVYLDLALSKKGVCRHRAFAFMITAIALGLPTRMIKNEAHVWVEVFDGRLWRRIDLGGAGRTLHDPLSTNVPYDPPPDSFTWPQGSQRGEDLAERMRHASNPPPTGSAHGANGADGGAPGAQVTMGTSGAPGQNGPNGTSSGGQSSGGQSSGGPSGRPANGPPDDRPASLIAMTLTSADAHRGAPLKLKGLVSADGEACGHVTVEIVLRSRAHGDTPIGQLATDDKGTFDGSIVLPSVVPLGEYEVRARTFGDQRCGVGFSR